MSEAPAPAPAPDPRARIVTALLIAAALLLAHATRPSVLVDDAAISLRYAERLASGRGFTYNDHERVQGASNPLYVLTLAALHGAGVDLESAVRAVDAVAFAASVALVFRLALALGAALPFAALAGAGAALDWFFRYQLLWGLEVGLATALGLAALVALARERHVLCGALLGLAVVNKLDAGLLALAVAGAWLAARRRPPWTIAAVASAVAAPWFAFSLAYFGGVVPNSLRTKLFVHAMQPHDNWSVVRLLGEANRWLLVVLTLIALVAFARPARARHALAAAALGGWLLLHGLAVSFVHLGDAYPWYRAPLLPPLFVLAAVGATWIAGRAAPRPARALAAAALLALALYPGARASVETLAAGNPPHWWELFDGDRRAAGEFLARFAAPEETVRSAFGWVAYPIRNRFDDTSGLNSHLFDSHPRYEVTHGSLRSPDRLEPRVLPELDLVPLVTFERANRVERGYGWFTLFGTRDSRVGRTGQRTWTLRELAPPTAPTDGGLNPQNSFTAGNLFAHPPSRLNFRFAAAGRPAALRFRPGFAPELPAGRSDGVVFEVLVGGCVVHERLATPHAAAAEEIVWLSGGGAADPIEFTLVTLPGSAGNSDYDWSIWEDARVIVDGGLGVLPEGPARERGLDELARCAAAPANSG